MSIVSGLYDVLQAQATLDHTRAVTQDTQALATQRMQNQQLLGLDIQQRQNTQQAMQNVASGFKGYDPALAPDPNDSATEAMRKEAGRQRQDAQFMRQMAIGVAKAGGDMKAVDEWNNRANFASWRATQASREALGEAKNENTQIASIAASVRDDDSLNAAMNQMAQINGKVATNLSTQLDRDPFTGGFVYGPKSQNVLNAIAAQGNTVAKQQDLALKAQQEADRALKVRQDADVSAARVRELDARTATEREHGELYKAQREGTLPGKTAAAKAAQPVRPATNSEKDSARDAILADPDFKEQKFDNSIGAFASDVANRAKKIMRDNPDMSTDDAQQQALEELKPFVAGRVTGRKEFAGITYNSGEQVKSYTRGGAARAAQAAPAAQYQEGQTATNPQTGEKMVFKGGKWQKM